MSKTASTISSRAPMFGLIFLVTTGLATLSSCSGNTQTTSPEENTNVTSAGSSSNDLTTGAATVLAAADTPAAQAPAQVDSTTGGAVVSDKKKRTLGRRSFLQCRACHSLKKGEANLAGPNLHGLFGSNVASKPDFSYSTALSSTGVTWNEETLTAWLKDPKSFAPGTLMVFDGIKDDQQLSYLIDYLKIETSKIETGKTETGL